MGRFRADSGSVESAYICGRISWNCWNDVMVNTEAKLGNHPNRSQPNNLHKLGTPRMLMPLILSSIIDECMHSL
jgi:hypothetical protein